MIFQCLRQQNYLQDYSNIQDDAEKSHFKVSGNKRKILSRTKLNKNIGIDWK